MKTKNINDIPHEYHSCEEAITKWCNGNNFSQIVKNENKNVKIAQNSK